MKKCPFCAEEIQALMNSLIFFSLPFLMSDLPPSTA